MTNLKNHYDNLKVLKNAKPFVIEAAYKAILQDLSSSNTPENLKQKEIIVASYSVLSDPIQRSAYDKEIYLQPKEKIEYSNNKFIPKEEINQKLDDTKKIRKKADEDISKIPVKSSSLKKKAFVAFVSVVSAVIVGGIGYFSYLKITEKPDIGNKNISENLEDNPVKSYDSLKQTEIERANSKQQRRDEMLAQQEKMEFEDFAQQTEGMKKIMQSDIENIALLQKSIQESDLKIQENIKEKVTLEQEESVKYSKDESVRQIEIKSIFVEQNQIARDLIEKEKHGNDLEKQLLSLQQQEEILSKQSEIKFSHDKAILDITTKLNDTWSSMSNDIESSLKGLNKKVISEYRCIVNVRLNYDGKVLDVSFKKDSGNSDFDYLVKIAIQQASPFIVPQDPDMFDKEFKSINLTFTKNSVIFK
jgi:hypothetical protein